jgi:tetratricopeptide (TPR) repeat protein
MKKYFLALALVLGLIGITINNGFFLTLALIALMFSLVSKSSNTANANKNANASKNENADKNEIDKCFAYLNSQNYQLALQAGKNAVELYPNNADAHWCLGAAYYHLGDFNSSIEELKTAERLTGDEKILAEIYRSLGGDYLNLNDFNTALLYYSKSLKIYTDLDNTEKKNSVLCSIATIYTKMGDYDKALEYYNKGLQLIKNPNDIAGIYNNVGIIYKNKGDNNKAIECFKKAIRIDQKNGNYRGLAYDMLNIASIYIDLNNFSEAERYSNQGFDIAKKIGSIHLEAYAHKILGLLYLKQYLQESSLEMYFMARLYLTGSYDLYKVIGNDSEAQRIYETYIKPYLENIAQRILETYSKQ